MRLPKEVLILGERYRLKRVSGLIEREGIEGYCSATDLVIALDKSLKGDHMRKVLLHEICHAWAYESGLSQFLTSQALEMMCQSFVRIVYDLPRR